MCKVIQINHPDQVIPDQFVRGNFEMVQIQPFLDWPKMINDQISRLLILGRPSGGRGPAFRASAFKKGISALDDLLVSFF